MKYLLSILLLLAVTPVIAQYHIKVFVEKGVRCTLIYTVDDWEHQQTVKGIIGNCFPFVRIGLLTFSTIEDAVRMGKQFITYQSIKSYNDTLIIIFNHINKTKGCLDSAAAGYKTINIY